jgi:hypothetical protein
MNLDVIVTATNVATLLVLIGTAIAATVQFRHVRTSNELAAVLAIEREFSADDVQNALLFVQEQLAGRLADPAYRATLAARGYIDPSAHPEMTACNWFNEMGSLIAGGFVNEQIFLNSFGRLVEYYWELLLPVIALVRRERGPDQYAKFEYLAHRAKRQRERARGGVYPAGVPRMPLPDPPLTADRAAGSSVGR